MDDHSYNYDKKDHKAVSALLTGVVTVVCIVISAGLWNLTWLQIWIAPKIFLIEYAAKLVK